MQSKRQISVKCWPMGLSQVIAKSRRLLKFVSFYSGVGSMGYTFIFVLARLIRYADLEATHRRCRDVTGATRR